MQKRAWEFGRFHSEEENREREQRTTAEQAADSDTGGDIFSCIEYRESAAINYQKEIERGSGEVCSERGVAELVISLFASRRGLRNRMVCSPFKLPTADFHCSVCVIQSRRTYADSIVHGDKKNSANQTPT